MLTRIIRAIQLISVTVNATMNVNSSFSQLNENCKLLSNILFKYEDNDIKVDTTAKKYVDIILADALNENKTKFPNDLIANQEYELLDKFWIKVLDMSETKSRLEDLEDLENVVCIHDDFIKKSSYFSAILKMLARNNALMVERNTFSTRKPDAKFSINAVYIFILREIECIGPENMDRFKAFLDERFNLMVTAVNDNQSFLKLKESHSIFNKLSDYIQYAIDENKMATEKFNNLLLSLCLVDKFQNLLIAHEHFVMNIDVLCFTNIIECYSKYIRKMKDFIVILFAIAIHPDNMDKFIQKFLDSESK